MRPLTPKQEKFSQCVASGMTQADAYREAFGQGNMTDKSIVEKASTLMATVNVKSRVDSLQKELASKALWTREESVEVLKNLLVNTERGNEIVSAVKELNAMHGYNAPTKHIVEGTLEVTGIIRKVVD